MKIEHGLLPGQVLQRERKNRGGTTISGTCAASGDVELRVTGASGKVVPGHRWQCVGEAAKKSFVASLSGLKAGGPYVVELRIRSGRKVAETIAVPDIFVGDIWFLAGQSNMEGVGNLSDAPMPHSKVRAFYMRDEWAIAKEGLHLLSEAVDVVHNGYGNGPDRPARKRIEQIRRNQIKGVGPGHAFGLEMYRRTRVPQGLIACAHGGTSMAQWSPALRDQGGASFYGAMMRRYEKLGQPVAGVVWYQGESEANEQSAEIYTDKMIELVAATRSDMGLPTLPWLVVQIGCHAAKEAEKPWNDVQEQQRRLPDVIKHLDVTTAIDLELDDGIHIGGKGQCVLGRRLARIADRLVHGTRGAKPGITVKKVELVPTPNCNVGAACTSVQITYGNVSGKLVSPGRPTGFTLLNAKGEDVAGIFKTTLHGNRVLLHSNMAACMLETMSVSYGHGRMPFCNITDSDGMGVPGMQGFVFDPEHAPYCDAWQTTPLPGVKSIAKVSHAKAAGAKGWKKAPPRAGFGVLPKPAELQTVAVYAMRTTLRTDEALEGELIFGANAPFKIWLNGKQVAADPTCTMPVDPGQYRIPLPLKKGSNRLVLTFAPPTPGAHFGICARIGGVDGKRDPRIQF